MDKKKRHSKNALLFWSLLKISATTFGGGFVIVPLLKSKFVDDEKLIDEEEMLDLLAISQSCPGPIAVNASTMVGYKISGIKGAFIAILATIIPPLTIITIISIGYKAFRDNILIKTLMSGMLCGVVAVIIDVVYEMTKKLDKKFIPIAVLIISLIMGIILKINVIWIIGLAAVIGLINKEK